MLPLFTKLSARNTAFAPRGVQVRSIVLSAREQYFTAPRVEDPIDRPTKVERTVLAGGTQVLSVDTPTPTTTLSLYVNAGSRYENRQTIHAATFLKHLGYKGTHEKSALRLVRDVEHIGATFQTETTRDTVGYHIRGLRLPEKSDSVNLTVMAETLRYVLNPLLLEYEIERIRPIVAREAESAEHNPRIKLFELIHAEAFRDTGLGQPFVPSYAVKKVTPQTIHAHVKNFYYPGDRLTIVGTGIDHQQLVSKLEPLFADPTLQGKFRELRAFPPLPDEPQTPQKSTFVGGGAIRLAGSGNTHVAIAFSGAPIAHKDNLALSILSEILGGGTLTNAGPGDARHTSRLYANVLEKHTFIDEVSTYQLSYSDAGLFGVYVSATPGHGKDVVSAVVDVLKSSVSTISAEDVTRGQRAVKNKFLRGLASDRFNLAQHVATVGTGVAEHVSAVEAVTLGDVQRVSRAVLGTNPVVVAIGDVRGVPKLN